MGKDERVEHIFPIRAKNVTQNKEKAKILTC